MKVFEEIANIEIVGQDTLEIIESEKSAFQIYRIKGLKPIVVIRDLRPNQAQQGDTLDLSKLNCRGAVTIHQLQNDSILIDINETSSAAHSGFGRKYTLRITGAVDELVPNEKTVFDYFDFRNDNSLVYISATYVKTSRRTQSHDSSAVSDWSFMSV